MSTDTSNRASVSDLHSVEGQAELIGGRIVRYPFLGIFPAQIVGSILQSLADYQDRTGRGEPFTSTLAYIVPELPSGRESFSPDASYSFGPFPEDGMKFPEGAPAFAVEIRNEHEYTPSAERSIAAKRADYFAAGTLVVWDVDPLAETIASYSADRPDQPTLFTLGQTAHAEPAVPGWRVSVDDIFGANA